MQVILEGGIPIKVWSDVGNVEPEAIQQLRNISERMDCEKWVKSKLKV